ncbi:MAG: triose-phosphate isomerase [Alphaproteobacteria bacterium]
MTRRPILAGNWKMNLLTAEAGELTAKLAAEVGNLADRDVVLIPPFTLLTVVKEAIADTNIELGAQNAHAEPRGAFTGEVSMPMLVDIGCRYVVIGHSERRQYFGETSVSCRDKIAAALAAGLTPIYCFGEKLAEREEDRTFEVIKEQLAQGLTDFDAPQAGRMVLAYEPVWAIGTGKTASPAQAQEVHKYIRDWLAGRFGEETAEQIRIQYGGSVKPNNVDELMTCADVDGALVGGASLKADDFARIVRFKPA